VIKWKESIYLDTTLPSAYFDNREPEKMKNAQVVWKIIVDKYEVYISEITVAEINATTNSLRRNQMIKLVKDFPIFSITREIEFLAKGYIEQKIIPVKYTEDALHVACASIHKVDFFLTWNCTHIASAHKRKAIRFYNLSVGIFYPEIILPEELLGEEAE
jgi:predicted nucleic acid-binding protein